MSTMEDLFIQPYMFEPKSDPEREENEDGKPAEPHLQTNALQQCVITVFTPSSSIPSNYVKECRLHFKEFLMLGGRCNELCGLIHPTTEHLDLSNCRFGIHELGLHNCSKE
ncbi:hypothetical protein AMECASPLE_000704 [Ameca splendens]|uniref:Uncharacterized protein n=1 Tax=Ameca splendens TaxID=208324 RepID=A0ABV0ZTK2_9TELE